MADDQTTTADVQPALSTPVSAFAPRDYKAFGFAVSGVWLTFILGYAWHEWRQVVVMNSHDFIDSFGGVFAPLAFLWLVLGYLQQGEELRHSSHALHLQAQELAHSVEQQKALVEATREQIASEREARASDLAEDERRSRPIFRLTNGGHSSVGLEVTQTFHLSNVGAKCMDLSVISSAITYPIEKPAFETGARLDISLMFQGRTGLQKETFVINYLNQRGRIGRTDFVIPIQSDPSYGHLYGSPQQIESPG